jgi:hypothetical protein
MQHNQKAERQLQENQDFVLRPMTLSH